MDFSLNLSSIGSEKTSNTNADNNLASDGSIAARTLAPFFIRAGAPSIADLGFDAQPNEADGNVSLEATTNSDLIGFPGERIGHISYGFEGERWRIRNAVWVIAQAPTGQQALDHIYRAGYRIAFDSMVTNGDHLLSFTNVQDKAICLDSRASNDQLVSMLAMRIGYASAAVDGLFYDSTMMPPAALNAHRMASAYAIALQQQITFELKNADSLPATADKELYWRLTSRLYPRSSSAYAQTALNDLARTSGSAMATAIREIYAHKQARHVFDCEVVNYYRALPINLLKDPKAMTAHFDATAQAFKLKFPSIAYAMQHDPKLDFTDPVNTSAAQDIVDAIATLAQTRRNAGVKDRDSWHIDVTK